MCGDARTTVRHLPATRGRCAACFARQGFGGKACGGCGCFCASPGVMPGLRPARVLRRGGFARFPSSGHGGNRPETKENDRLPMRGLLGGCQVAAGQKENVGAGRWTVRKQEARISQTSKLVDTMLVAGLYSGKSVVARSSYAPWGPRDNKYLWRQAKTCSRALRLAGAARVRARG